MQKKLRRLINQVKKHLVKKYGKEIKQVILYGSHVRKEATKDSDIDLLVIISDSLNPSEVRNSVSDLLFNIILREKEQISVITLPEYFFNNYKSPFILNVKSEGMAV
jgi:predicted nucleotidyltransferase